MLGFRYDVSLPMQCRASYTMCGFRYKVLIPIQSVFSDVAHFRANPPLHISALSGATPRLCLVILHIRVFSD